MTRPIYLDHHATTPLDPRVAAAMQPYWTEEFGNAASRTHEYGWRAEAAVELAREQIAEAIGASDPREIVFTSGATESDNLALQGVARGRSGRGDHLVISALEHPAVTDTARALVAEGFRVSVVAPDPGGRIPLEAFRDALEERTVLASVIAANGEIGTVQDLRALAEVCREREIPFHTDAAQAIGKVPFDVSVLGVDLASISGHKIHGPKGIGALYLRRSRPRLRLRPILHGGGHEYGLRSGSVPVPLVVGLARATVLAVAEREQEGPRLAKQRDHLLGRLREALPGVHVNGGLEHRLPANLNVSFDGLRADALLPAMPELALSTGSACSSARPEPSPVLLALGLPEARIRGALRVGLGRFTRDEEIDRAADVLIRAVRALRSADPASPGPGPAATLPGLGGDDAGDGFG